MRTILREPSGVPQQRWINEVPNEGLIHYQNYGNESRLMPTSPKAIAEVLVQKSYEFVKPAQIRLGIGRILGVGVLLAEGDEHKVKYCDMALRAGADVPPAATEESHAGFRVQAYQRSLPFVLVEIR